MVNLEEEEYQDIEELDAEEAKLISRLPEYIPPQKGRTKVTKDPDSRKFIVSTPLFLEHVEFEGTTLVHIPVLKMEDWDLENHDRFSHLATNMYMTKIYYE